MRIIFTSDLHGELWQYQRLLAFVRSDRPDALLLGGDLFPKKGGLWSPNNNVRTIASQKKFIEDYWLNFIREIADLIPVYFIFGNDDFRALEPLVKKIQPNVNYIGEIGVSLGEWKIVGYPFVGLTPFLQKDWEKWDVPGSEERKIFVTAGYHSVGEGFRAVDYTNPTEAAWTVAIDFERLAVEHDPAKTIYLFHDAPFGTNLDMTTADNPFLKDGQRHIGNLAMRQFIEAHQPLATLHGHIHETVTVSGQFMDKLGRTVNLGVGNDYSSNHLAVVVMDPALPQQAQRILLDRGQY